MATDIVGRGWAFPPQVDETGRVKLIGGVDDISEAIRMILNTAPGERVMRPDFGSRLYELVFAPLTLETISLAERYVKQALARWEPRIEVVEVIVAVPYEKALDSLIADGCLLIEIQYVIKLTRDPRSLVYPFYSIPGE